MIDIEGGTPIVGSLKDLSSQLPKPTPKPILFKGEYELEVKGYPICCVDRYKNLIYKRKFIKLNVLAERGL